MSENAHSEEYQRARSAFDQLKIDDRAVFLVEATVATVARGLDEVGRAAGQILDDLFKSRGRAASDAATPPSEEVRPPFDAPGAHIET